MTGESILIDRRFRGPPESGNGGYVCGRLAQLLDGTSAAVRLHRPPPLDRELEVRRSETGVALLAGNALVAEARPARVALEPPEPPGHAEAEAASRRFRGFDSHRFPSCFVCGPHRDACDGLGIFPGPLGRRGLVACPWVPDPSLACAEGSLAPEFLWAALDCPGAFAFPEPAQGVVLLGELQVALAGAVSPGERCVLVAWELAREGRKHPTATALFGESGARRGIGLGTWLEVVREPASAA